MHQNPPILLKQAPWIQGLDLHESSSSPHVIPVNPVRQLQKNWLSPFVHVPPLRHGWLSHSSRLVC